MPRRTERGDASVALSMMENMEDALNDTDTQKAQQQSGLPASAEIDKKSGHDQPQQEPSETGQAAYGNSGEGRQELDQAEGKQASDSQA